MLCRHAVHHAGRILVGGTLCPGSVCILRVCGVAQYRLQSREAIDCACNRYSRYDRSYIREFMYLMRLYCGGVWWEIRSISPSAFSARLLACLLAFTSSSIIYTPEYICGGVLVGNTVYFPVCFLRTSAGMLAGLHFEVYNIYSGVYICLSTWLKSAAGE